MSEVKVNKISPRSGTTVTLGDSGDTFTLASGVSLTGVNATFSGDLTVDTNTLYVDSTNNRVGIGTSSPSSQFHSIAGTEISLGRFEKSGGALLDIIADSNRLYLRDATSSTDNALILNSTSNQIEFYTNSSERMRIDSSGNVLVGKTSTDLGTAGTALLPSGVSFFTRDGDKVLRVNRLTSDGDIIDLLKDGTTVGSIGTVSGEFYVGGRQSSRTGLIFGINQITPTQNDGSTADNIRNLGSSTARWKDIYVGSNIYLGGTGSANALDDYEEGTFTPSWGGGTTDPSGVYSTLTSGSYTKVGRLVTVLILIRGGATTSAGSGSLLIRGLPFASATTTGAERGSFNINYSNDFLADNSPAGGFGTSGESYINLVKYSSDPRDGLFSTCTTTGSLNTGSSNFNYIIIGGHYYTD